MQRLLLQIDNGLLHELILLHLMLSAALVATSSVASRLRVRAVGLHCLTWPGHLKAVWLGFGGDFLRSGRPWGSGKAFKRTQTSPARLPSGTQLPDIEVVWRLVSYTAACRHRDRPSSDELAKPSAAPNLESISKDEKSG